MTSFANRCGIPGLGSDQHRLRLVVMGDSFVGKSAIIKRFLFGRFVGDQFMRMTTSKCGLLSDSPQSTQRRWKISSVVISASPVLTTPLRWTSSILQERASSRPCGGEYGGILSHSERCALVSTLYSRISPSVSTFHHFHSSPDAASKC